MTMNDLNLHARGGMLRFSDNLDNPNRMPFTGILTYLGVPSDQPPGGSGGLKVMIPVDVGKAALPSLKGMPVNLAASMDDHDTSAVVGHIEEAWLGEPDARGAVPVHVSGIVYAKSFPDEAREIKAQKERLGFSYETAKTSLTAGMHNGEKVAVAQSLVFTGAAILYKQSAAYQTTSLAAAKLTVSGRKDFALPSKQEFPMPDAEHVKLAWDMVDRANGLSDAERQEARHNILKRAKELGVDTSDWNKGEMKAAGDDSLARTVLEAISDLKDFTDKRVDQLQDYVDERMDDVQSLVEKLVIDEQVEQIAEEGETNEVKAKGDITLENNENKNLATPEVENTAIKELTASVASLAEIVKGLATTVTEIKSAQAETIVTAAAEPAPARTTLTGAQLSAKFDKEVSGTELVASIDAKNLDINASMAAKLALLQ